MDASQNFAEKLKAWRKKAEVTQSELADRLGYSEKSVSKWECGGSLPPIEVAIRLARIMGTTVEAMFGSSGDYYLAIDGGGTKTVYLLCDSEGSVIRTHRGGATNPADLGFDAAVRELERGIRLVLGDLPPSEVRLFAGIAGGTSAGMQERLSSFFGGFGFAAYASDSDVRSIIAAGLGEGDGIAMIMGTGICAFVQRGGECSRIAGWGYLIDGGGSGYDLGRDALAAYFSVMDGRSEPSPLTEEVAAIYEGGATAIMSYIYSEGKRAVASFAPAVYAAYGRGDALAEAILVRNIDAAAEIARAAAERFPEGERVRLLLAGGIASRELTRKMLEERLDPERFDITGLDCEPVMGALALAMKIKGETER